MTSPFFFRDSTQAHPNRSLLGQVEVGHTSDSSFMFTSGWQTDRFWLVFSKLVMVFGRNWVDLKL